MEESSGTCSYLVHPRLRGWPFSSRPLLPVWPFSSRPLFPISKQDMKASCIFPHFLWLLPFSSFFPFLSSQLMLCNIWGDCIQVFFPGGMGDPPSWCNLVDILPPPIRHLYPFSDQSLSPSTQYLSKKNCTNLIHFSIDFWLLLSLKLP